MLKNYLKTALRSFRRQQGYALLNVGGLTLGLACCLLLFQYVAYEHSFDRFHTQRDRLYRGGFEVVQDGAFQRIRGETGFNLGPVMAEAIPEIVRYARLHPNYGSAVFSYGSGAQRQAFKAEGVVYADSTFLRMFDFPLVRGDRDRALTEPRTMLLSASMARKHFGEADPVGETIEVTGWVRGPYTVAGVFEDVPPASHLRFDYLLPMRDLLALERYRDPERGWDRPAFATYFELAPGADVAAVERKLTEVYDRHRHAQLAETHTRVAAHLQPLLDIHLNPDITAPVATTGSRRTVRFFLLIGLVTLLIALVNYVNLSTARALDRAREVAVRKVVGAQRRQLVVQFMTESVLMNGAALVLAAGLAVAALPAMNALAGVHLSGAAWLSGPFWAAVLGVFAVGTLLAGLYPAFVLSSFRPLTALKGGGTLASRATLRKTLVVVQFAASIVLLVGTAVVYGQLTFMREMDVGLAMEQVLVVERPRVRGSVDRWAVEMATLKDELRALPGVGAVGLSSTTPGGGFDWYAPVFRPTDDPSEGKPARATEIDHDFMGVYGLEVVAGEPFREGLPLSDTEGAPPVLVNETLVRAVGFASNAAAVGQQIHVQRGVGFTIHGVVSDFNWSSAHQPAEAVVLLYETRYGDVSMTVRPDGLPETLAAVRRIYDRLFPGNPFVYRFADEIFDAQYRSDERFAALFAVFAGLAVFIACLGLFGLAAFATARRTREIGIRKVLGASVTGLVGLLSKDFLKLVGVALVVAVPVAYVVMQRWLAGFAYRIDLSARVFVLAGLAALAIALATVSYQAVKAALADPVRSLRHE